MPDPIRHPEAWLDGPQARFALDSWEMDGLPTVAIAAHGREAGFAVLVSYDRRLRMWETGSATFVLDGTPRDRDWFARTVKFDGAHRTDLIDLGLLGKGRRLALALSELMLGIAGPKPHPHDAAEDAAPRDPWRDMAAVMLRMPVYERAGDGSARAYGFADPGEGRLRPPVSVGSVSLPDRMERALDGLVAGVGERLRDAVLGLAEPEDREALALLGGQNWSADAHRFYAFSGRVGQRRRQAGRLYPALAPLIARRPEVSLLVDKGRPYDAALLDELRGMLPEDGRDGLTAAAIRRLRTLAPCPFPDVHNAVTLAAALPVDWLPRDAAGWEGMLAYLGRDIDAMAAAGVAVADLLGHVGGDWERLADVFPLHPERRSRDRQLWLTDPSSVMGGIEGVLLRARDMRVRLSETLVGQVRESLRLPEPAGGDRRLAGRILFGGRSLVGIERLQLRWHAGLPRLEAELPAHEETNAWPAAFPPFRAANGLEIVCLTDEAQLKDEGAEGADRDGRPGLDHCVGGYGRRCHAGEAHVASVRRPSAEGFERVSTVEFTPHVHEGGVGVLFVDQHLARGNGDPPEEAIRAFADLAEAVAEGRHPLDRGAVERQGADGFRDGFDWRVPGALERAHAAWSDYLPRDLRGSHKALGARVAAEVARMDRDAVAALDAPEVILDIETGGLSMR